MRSLLAGVYYSFPVQLVILHLKRFQILLFFWLLLFSTASGRFMDNFGADSLFLAPEYLDAVSFFSTGIMGMAVGVYIMSWNITTFILFSRYFRFLATTANPFLKFCVNNAILPLGFLLYYCTLAVGFMRHRELMSGGQIALCLTGFLAGLTLILLISFLYFFRADRSIVRTLAPVIGNPRLFKQRYRADPLPLYQSRVIEVKWYLNENLRARKVRDISHYSREFVENIFSRHHFAAVICIFIAFLFLIFVGFWLDSPFFQLPAAAGFTIFFAILIALSGAFSYFFQAWSIPVLALVLVALNLLFRQGIIDPGNKAYGMDYRKESRPVYSAEALAALCTEERIARDKEHMLEILGRWKARQAETRPYMFIINTSGGGNRSANFTMNVMRRLDSICGGELMRRTFLITGASGGMLGASYYRELASRRGKGLDPLDPRYVDDISLDLLNSVFTSFVARDLASPAQSFRIGDREYIKDRGYAFERKLDQNTRGLLNKRLADLEEDERLAQIPLMLLNAVVTRDGRKMIIGTQPMSFLMRPAVNTTGPLPVGPDAIDFGTFFANQDPGNLRLLTALRMNATFPYVLPNVWLPSEPVIDVMDAGLRDNYGYETAVRFVQVFRDWLAENTAGVVMIQVRDRILGGWDHPYESRGLAELFTKPFLILQYNWYKMQDYAQDEGLSLLQTSMDNRFHRIVFQYAPSEIDAGAALNFHLTRSEKRNILEALDEDANREGFRQFLRFLPPSSEE